MFFNSRSLFTTALVSYFAWEASALPKPVELVPISGPGDIRPGGSTRRSAAAAPPLELLPISDPGILTHGRSLKREAPGNEAFDPTKAAQFFWGAYAGDNIYIANFTLDQPGDDEYILPLENFAKHLKSLDCGDDKRPMTLEFENKESFDYAKTAWQWVDKEDINHFTLVTEPNRCYDGDNRSPYLVEHIQFDDAQMKAIIKADEKEWADVAHTFKLHVGHEYVDPATANVTHPHLKRGESKTMDITHSFNQEIFNYAKDSKETAGMGLSANAEISTGGSIIADFDIEKKLGFIPTDVKINIHPQGVHADFILSLTADGKLGKELDWSLKPEIEIPVGALNIKKVLEIGPFVTMGVHFGSSALEGTGTMTTGARAKIDDAAKVAVTLRKPEENSIDGWTPKFEKIDPTFSAEVGGNLRAWGELGIQIKAEAFGRWGYQASVDAQLPYFEAQLSGVYDTQGVCGSQKTVGVDINNVVGINVNLNAGKVNEAPTFEKDLFETSWPLFTTCIGIGKDNAKTSEPTPEPTTEPEPSEEPIPSIAEPTGDTLEPNPSAPVETPISEIMPSPVITPGPTGTGTGIIGTGTGTGTAGFPITANTTFLDMRVRRPTALFF